MEFLDDTGKQKIERSQTQDRENVRSGNDEAIGRDAEHQCGKDAPKKNAKLIICGNFEVGKNQQEGKEIIDRKRQLDEVAGDELEPLLVACRGEKFPAQGTEQKAGKNQRERNP